MTLFDSQGNYLVPPELALETKRGNKVPNEQRREVSPERMNAAMEVVKANHPTAVERSLRSTYNCMGMVFASRRTCVDIDHLTFILADDGYRKIVNESEVQVGDLAVYRGDSGDFSHVGIVYYLSPYGADGNRDIFVMSQWGRDGEYYHRVDDVNVNLGKPAEYWTDRT